MSADKPDHPASDLPVDKIEMLSQPLLTEGGFVNPACMSELEAAIRCMPKTHDRLSGDREWSTPHCSSMFEIIGALAGNAVRAFRGVPPRLDYVVHLTESVLRRTLFAAPVYDKDGIVLADASLCGISKALHEALMDEPSFAAWNDEEKVGKQWIDLDALLHQVCVEIRNERRHSLAFDIEFHKAHGCSPSHGGMDQ